MLNKKTDCPYLKIQPKDNEHNPEHTALIRNFPINAVKETKDSLIILIEEWVMEENETHDGYVRFYPLEREVIIPKKVLKRLPIMSWIGTKKEYQLFKKNNFCYGPAEPVVHSNGVHK